MDTETEVYAVRECKSNHTFKMDFNLCTAVTVHECYTVPAITFLVRQVFTFLY